MKKYNCNEIWLTGAEIYWLNNQTNKKLFISIDQGNEMQRTYEPWDDERKEAYKNSLLEDFPHTPFYFISHKNKWYVVDGQHRMLTISELVEDEMISDVYEETSIHNKLFRIVVVKCEMNSEEEMIEFGSKIFLTLNNTQTDVKNGSILQIAMKRIDVTKTKEMIKKFRECFATSKEFSDDQVCDAIGTSLYMLENYSKNMSSIQIQEAVFEYIDSFKKTDSKKFDEFLDILEKMKANQIYGNKTNNKINVAYKSFYIPIMCAIKVKGIEHAVKFKDTILYINLYSREEWKKNSKKSRAANALKYAAHAIIDAADPTELVVKFEKA